MADIVVELGSALICFLGQCRPALIGATTPVGEFTITLETTDAPGYGGDLLVFEDDGETVLAIHRVLDVPGQDRPERLKSDDPAKRLITMGCVNVTPEVYLEIVDCCSKGTLQIRR